MPRGGRKRSNAEGSTVSTFANDYVAPGGGTEADISKLSTVLNLPTDATLAIMNCGGQGVRSSGRRSGADETAAAASALDPSMMNVWGDFMSEEMDSAPAASSAAPAASSASKPAAASSSNDAAGITTAQRVAAASSEDPSSGSRDYILPIQPRMRLVGKGKKVVQ